MAREKFKAEVLALDRYRCIGSTVFASQHRCTGSLQAHHCVTQAKLRTHISTLGLDEDGINDWIWNPGVGATVCDGLHGAHTAKVRGAKPFAIPFEWLPARVVDWCESREIVHLLLVEHPPVFSEV